MKKNLLPLLALAMFSGLFSRGFQFVNDTGRNINLEYEARTDQGKIVNSSVKLKSGQCFTRRDFKKVKGFRVTTKAGAVGFFASFQEREVAKNLKPIIKGWEKDMDEKSNANKIRRIRIYIKNNGLRAKFSSFKEDQNLSWWNSFF